MVIKEVRKTLRKHVEGNGSRRRQIDGTHTDGAH